MFVINYSISTPNTVEQLKGNTSFERSSLKLQLTSAETLKTAFPEELTP
jgi:hypothetical protein